MGRKAATLTLALACSCAVPELTLSAHGDAADLVVQHDFRLRWEQVRTDAQPKDAGALTLRLRSSVETRAFESLTVLAELEAIAALLPDDRNGFFAPSRPAVPDGETLELNRLQAEFTPSEAVSIALGRQRIALADERFIGTVDFRQNQQTYDAVVANFTAPTGFTVEAGYVWQVNRFLGERRDDGTFSSDSTFFQVSAPSPIGQVSAYHFDLDLDPGTGPNQQSETFGAALDGRAFQGDFGVFWTGAYAQQTSNGATPTYSRAGVSVEWGDLSAGIKYEHLGSEDGVAFQTPLATLHKFQGATDTFVVTPTDGIEDIQVSGTWRIGSAGELRGVRMGAQFNEFTAAEAGGHYGREFGASLSAGWRGARWSLAWSGYEADGFGSDTDKVWVTVSQRF